MPPEPHKRVLGEPRNAARRLDTWPAVADLARRQHGVVTARQLNVLGIGREAIKYRLRTGELNRIYAGVYAVGHRYLTQRGRWMAAVLAGGERAVLAGRAAAALQGFRATAASWIHVITPVHRGRRRGIIFHEASLHPADRDERHGIPVTAIPRTLLDLARELHPTQLGYAFWEAERVDLIDPHELRAFLARSHGRRGMAQLRPLADRLLPPDLTVRSSLERRFYELIRDSGLPLPAMNTNLEGFEVDACWLEQKLVVELDGRTYHSGARAFETDRIRDATLQAAGYRVIRLTDRTVGGAVAMLRRLINPDALPPMLERDASARD